MTVQNLDAQSAEPGGPTDPHPLTGAHTAIVAQPAVPVEMPGDWPRVSVVIPTLNEAQNLPHVFARMPGGSTR